MSTPTHLVSLYEDNPQTIDPALLGGKGAGLFHMVKAGVPVPEAVILTTEAWKEYRETGLLTADLKEAVAAFLDKYPDSMFSVRSGAPVSMPGMMDTVLNVGVEGHLDAKYPGAFRRFASSWLTIVKSVPKARVSELFNLASARAGDDPARWRTLVHAVVSHAEQVAIPDYRLDQVLRCVEAVFGSWDTPRAKAYRAMHGIAEDMGTACVIQRMVMGTAPGFSGSGVLFSRDPATGEQKVRGEFAQNAQGEEVVSGEVTPLPLEDMPKERWNEVVSMAVKLEHKLGDVQDIEFTYESGKLYVLQTRTAKMSARARIITACALAQSIHGGNTKGQLNYLRQRVTKTMVNKACVPTVATDLAPSLTGLAASPGAISGKIVFRTTPLSKVDKTCILVAEDTAPEDFPIMAKAGGILTKTGGFTCHSAVVARGIGVPAVVGAEAMKLDAAGIEMSGFYCKEGTPITIDGTTGRAWLGAHDVTSSQAPREIYSTLHHIILGNGFEVPEVTYYYDCGLGSHVVLPIDPEDAPAVERQLERAERLRGKGKTVAFAFELQGLGEDMFSQSPMTTFTKLAESYGADFKGATILYGIPSPLADGVAEILDVTVNKDVVSVLDLLDVLEG